MFIARLARSLICMIFDAKTKLPGTSETSAVDVCPMPKIFTNLDFAEELRPTWFVSTFAKFILLNIFLMFDFFFIQSWLNFVLTSINLLDFQFLHSSYFFRFFFYLFKEIFCATLELENSSIFIATHFLLTFKIFRKFASVTGSGFYTS